MITKYHNLSDEDILRMVDKSRQWSPIIEELARRLEDRIANPLDDTYVVHERNATLECPHCEGRVSFDSDGKLQ